MTSYMTQPAYINCFFFDKEDANMVYIYKIEVIEHIQYPFQLFKRILLTPSAWENLSIYATVHDAIRVLLKELLPDELADQVYHGQASVDPTVIADRLERGDRSISIFNVVDNELYRADRDVVFADMVRRQV